MQHKDIKEIISRYQGEEWILEPVAKKILSLAGLQVPQGLYSEDIDELISFASQTGFPLVAKVVSAQVMHKSDVKGVITDISNEQELRSAFDRLKRIQGFQGVLVEKMESGIELIVGAKIDFQFGPVILLGLGGTGVEIYQDVSIRMAPLQEKDILAMIMQLKAAKIIKGYRGSEPVNIQQLSSCIQAFSQLVTLLQEHIQSIDLNPLLCSSTNCIVADARIILKQ